MSGPFRRVLQVPLRFSNLTWYAQDIQQFTYARMAWSKAECKREAEYAQKIDILWKDVENWKKVTDEQIASIKRGEGLDPKKLSFG